MKYVKLYFLYQNKYNKMFQWVNPIYFMISFCIGIMFVYISTPSPQIVHKFPSPDNEDVVYKDNSNSCYKYNSKEVPCTQNAINQPIIEDFTKNELN